MKRLLVVAIVMLLAGCGITTPVKRNFPEAPSELKQACPELEQTAQTEKLSDVVKVVTDNYSQYHECRIKVDAWNEWYNIQKNIFDSVK
jgi:hypothetical protein